MKGLILILVLALSACSTQRADLSDVWTSIITTPPPSGEVTSPVAKTPIVAKSVAAAQVALTQLEKLALRYTTLPECGPTAPKLCHDPVIKAQIKEYDTYAFNAVMAARRGAGSLETAVSAIVAFQKIIP